MNNLEPLFSILTNITDVLLETKNYIFQKQNKKSPQLMLVTLRIKEVSARNYLIKNYFIFQTRSSEFKYSFK